MKFGRKPGFRLKANPQLVGEVCHQLEQDGKLTPKDLVNASRDKNAPLHHLFEWRDGVAAEKYREVQAGYIIRSVTIKITEIPSEVTTLNLNITEAKEEKVRFYHAVERDGCYDNINNIAADEEKIDELLKLCKRDALAFKEKYNVLRSVLPKLFDALDELECE